MLVSILLSVAAAQTTPGIEVAEADFVCVSPQARQEPLVGVPPMEVTCEVVLSDLFEYDTAYWRFGDGAEGEGDVVEHQYEIVGQYDIHLELEGLRYVVDDTGAPITESGRTRYGLVTACSVPNAEFSVEKRNGLRYEIVNRSDFLPGCVDDVSWTVVKGTTREGEVVFSEDKWSPEVVLPENGTYTFFLDLYGIAGGSAAALQVDAVSGVDEKLQGRRRWGCATMDASWDLPAWMRRR